jgi:hypothetical protein
MDMTRRGLFKFLPAGLGSLLFTGGDRTDTSVEEAIKLVVRVPPPLDSREINFELNGLRYVIFTTTNFLLDCEIGGKNVFETNVYCDYYKVCATVTKLNDNIHDSKVIRFESPHFHKVNMDESWKLHVDNIIRKSQSIHLSEFGNIQQIPPLHQLT